MILHQQTRPARHLPAMPLFSMNWCCRFVFMNIIKRCIWSLLMHGRRVALAQTTQSDWPRLSLRRGGRECTWTEEALAEKLGVIQQTVNTWISDIRARQKASKNTVILRLSRLACLPSFWRGWLQEKIAETTGITRGKIAQIVNNTNFGEINTLLSQGRDMDYIARHYNMDFPLARPPRLSGKSISSEASLSDCHCLALPGRCRGDSRPACQRLRQH